MGRAVPGDALDGVGRKQEARKAWEMALARSRRLEPGAQIMFVHYLEAKLKK